MAWTWPSLAAITLMIAFARRTIASPSRTVIMAAAMGYPLPIYERFLIPLRSVGFRGAVVLFVDERTLPAEVRLLCNRYNVTTRALPDYKTAGKLSATTSIAKRQSGAGNADPRAQAKGMARYIGYREVCDAKQFDHCFATDFRDVFFQSDPFTDVPRGAELVLAQEYAGVSIGACKHNSGWIRTCFGQSVLSRIAAQRIVCSGTIMGTPVGFRVLEDRMRFAMHLTAQRPRCALLDGVDQGRYNYLYHMGKLSKPTFYRPDGLRVVLQPRSASGSIVSTVGRGAQNVTLSADGVVVNDDGRPAPVVHQYDRAFTLACTKVERQQQHQHIIHGGCKLQRTNTGNHSMAS